MNAKSYVYIFFLLVTQLSFSQEILTLQQCVETGKKNNLDFQIRQLEILSAETTHRSPVMEYLPKVDFAGTHSYSIGSTIDPATNTRVSSNIQSDNFAINASMNLLDFNVFTAARRNKIAVLKSRADKEATAAEYSLSILENYFSALYTQELLKIRLDQFENAKFNMKRIEKEVEIGSKPKSDLYDMQVSYALEENGITETRQTLYNQKLILIQLMNVQGMMPDGIVLENPGESGSMAPIESTAYENALKNYAKIQSVLFAEEIAKKQVTIEKNGFLPILSAYYSYSSFYYLPLNQPGDQRVNPFWTQLNDNKNHYIGFQLNVPVFNGFRTNRNVQLAKIEHQKKTVETEQEKIKLRQTIEQETAKQQQNTEMALKLEDTRNYTEKSFTTTQSKFTGGLVDAIVFTAAKNQLLTAEYNLLKAKYTAQYLTLKLNFLQFNTF